MKAIYPALLLALLFACSPDPVSAQAPKPPADAPAARLLLKEAIRCYDSLQFSAGQERAELAFVFFQNQPETEPATKAESAYQAGRGWYGKGEIDTAQQRFELAAGLWSALYPQGSAKTANALHFIARCYYAQDQLDRALPVCDRAYEMRKKLQPALPCDLAESIRLRGNIQLQRGDYALAKQQYEEALALVTVCAGEESAQTADVLSNLGMAYLRLEQYQQAIAMQEKALLMRQKLLPATHRDLGMSFMGLGETYKKIFKFEEALFYYEKALAIQRKNSEHDDLNIAFAYSEIGQYFLAKKDYAQAKLYFEKENSVMVELGADQSSAYAYTCADLGRLYEALKDYAGAIVWYKKMVALWRNLFKHPNTQLASMLVYLGKARLNNGDYAAALQEFETAKGIYQYLLGERNYMNSKADYYLGNGYRKWYERNPQDSLLEKSRAHFRLAVDCVENQLPKETTAIAQQKILAESVAIYEQSIGAELLALTLRPGDEQLLENAWQFMEATHAHMLLSATQDANAKHFAKIPDAALLQDSLIRAKITLLEKERQSLLEHGSSLTDSIVLSQNARIFAKKEDAQALIRQFEQRYPDYFRLKYERHNISLQEIRQSLSPRQTLLEFFVGNVSIFVFVVNRESSKLLELPRDFPLNEWIQNIREGITGYQTSKQKTPALYEKTVLQYADGAQKLYHKLLAPIADQLKQELIVVPGDGFADLPFEALLSAAPSDPSNFNTYPFVLRKHTIQYAYSATMLQQMSDHRHQTSARLDLLALAPFFDEDTSSLALRINRDEAIRRGFSALPYTGEEVFRAKKRFGGRSEVFTGKLATKQKFLEMAARYRVLHLATHGKANHHSGDFSYLAFASEDAHQENGLLSVGELYNLSLNADLVLLSACETGVGEQQQGEGVVSIARAFAFAGAKSMVASLWSVNDKSTMQVMDNFYTGIKAGMPKNQALSKAKLDYLEKNPGQASHPFFWAGFVAIGDMSPLTN